jgi:hypothetical protein
MAGLGNGFPAVRAYPPRDSASHREKAGKVELVEENPRFADGQISFFCSKQKKRDRPRANDLAPA